LRGLTQITLLALELFAIKKNPAARISIQRSIFHDASLKRWAQYAKSLNAQRWQLMELTDIKNGSI